jgi:glutaconate CoA-transferase, subunit A
MTYYKNAVKLMSDMNSKVKELAEAANLINNGSTLAIGGLLLQRIPAAFVRELARQSKKNLKLIKTAANYDFDLLCFAGCVKEVAAGFVSFEAEFGLAKNFRKSVESENVIFNENSCYTVISSLRAAAYGVPFMPIANLKESYLADKFNTVQNPYGGDLVLTVPAIYPDWAVLHVQKADEQGNAIIYGPLFEDLIMFRSARKTIITTEKLVTPEEIQDEIDIALINGIKVEAVVEIPDGARPGSCYPYYDYSTEDVTTYLNLRNTDELSNYLEHTIP